MAPLVNSRRSSGVVQFWAAGRDCCQSGFDCFEARKGAKEGLVFLEEMIEIS